MGQSRTWPIARRVSASETVILSSCVTQATHACSNRSFSTNRSESNFASAPSMFFIVHWRTFGIVRPWRPDVPGSMLERFFGSFFIRLPAIRKHPQDQGCWWCEWVQFCLGHGPSWWSKMFSDDRKKNPLKPIYLTIALYEWQQNRLKVLSLIRA